MILLIWGINDEIKYELSLIPKEYSEKTATEDGCFVIAHDGLKSEISIMDTFVSDSKNKKSSSIIIVYYTDEGDPILIKVVYNGHKYYGIVDNTRDEFSSQRNTGYRKFKYKYLKGFEVNDRISYYLTNDNNLTNEDILQSWASCQSNDWIDMEYLCSYKTK